MNSQPFFGCRKTKMYIFYYCFQIFLNAASEIIALVHHQRRQSNIPLYSRRTYRKLMPIFFAGSCFTAKICCAKINPLKIDVQYVINRRPQRLNRLYSKKSREKSVRLLNKIKLRDII